MGHTQIGGPSNGRACHRRFELLRHYQRAGGRCWLLKETSPALHTRRCRPDIERQRQEGRSLCSLGTAEALLSRGSRGLQVTALVRVEWRRARCTRRLPTEHAATTENPKQVR